MRCRYSVGTDIKTTKMTNPDVAHSMFSVLASRLNYG